MDEAYAKLGTDGGGFDLSFPISVDIPALLAKSAIIELDKSLLPNIGNLGTEWSDPGYDPGNAHSIPYMWWTTGIALRQGQDRREADQQQGRSGIRASPSTSACSTTGRKSSG